MTALRVLVVEDDHAIADEVRGALELHGYDVRRAGTGREALDLFADERPDLVVLDLGLPDLDGLQVCRTLRAKDRAVPILIVTARDADIDVVMGLDAGGSDYVTKPFSVSVLLARIRAQLRNEDVAGRGEFDDLVVDVDAHRVFVGGREVDLRPKEFALLAVLTEAAGKVVRRDDLLRDVWDLHWETSTKTLDMHVHALRRKLGDRGDGRSRITTVRTVGYRFELA